MIIYSPEKKLKLLRYYLAYSIRRGTFNLSFDQFIKVFYPKCCYGTPHYWRSAATNCFYCLSEFNNKREATIDHFFPQSLGKDSEWPTLIICCKNCNGQKSAMRPELFISKFMRSQFDGLPIENIPPKKVKNIAKSVQQIWDDKLNGKLRPVYYWQWKEVIPKDFILIHPTGK